MIKEETKYGTIVIEDEERQECEIWTRVMGYYRPVQAFNSGKKQEHRDRLFFRENTEKISDDTADETRNRADEGTSP